MNHIVLSIIGTIYCLGSIYVTLCILSAEESVTLWPVPLALVAILAMWWR